MQSPRQGALIRAWTSVNALRSAWWVTFGWQGWWQGWWQGCNIYIYIYLTIIKFIIYLNKFTYLSIRPAPGAAVTKQ